jgi:hypothetical protein
MVLRWITNRGHWPVAVASNPLRILTAAWKADTQRVRGKSVAGWFESSGT